MRMGEIESAADDGVLRFITAGSVDDGKSTLIGRLLYDSPRDPRGPARRRRARLAAPRADGARPLAAHRRPGGRARAGHHHRRRLPLLRHAAPQVHHRRHARATSSTRATWSPAPSTADVAVLLIDARKGVLPQTRRTSISRVCWASGTSSSRSTRWTWSATTRASFDAIRAELPELRRAARDPRPEIHPDLGARRRHGRRARRPPRLVRRPDAARSARDGPGAGRGRGAARALPRAARDPRRRRRLAALHGPRRFGRAPPGDAVVVLPAGRRTTVREILGSTARARQRSPAIRSP